MTPLTTAFPMLKPFAAGATRRGIALDEVFSNMSACIENKEILRPLSKIDGTESDHSVITASCRLPRHQRPVVSTFEFRPITSKGVDMFRNLLIAQDWFSIKGITATESVNKLDDLLQSFVVSCFPSKTRKIRSCLLYTSDAADE